MEEQDREAEKLLLMVKAGVSTSEISAFLSRSPETVNARDGNGNTPLILAAYYGNDRLVKLLLSHGADASLKNGKGRDALYMARHEHEKASNEPSGSVYSEKLGQYGRILDMLYEISDADSLREVVRRESALSETTVFIFPSIHPDASEADQLQEWIRGWKATYANPIVMFELGSESRSEFLNLGHPGAIAEISKRINKGYRTAVSKMLEVFRDEGLRVYPIDTRASEHRKEYSKYIDNGAAMAVEHIIRGGGDVDALIKASVQEYSSANTWLHNRNLKMIDNVKELAEQNAPCSILLVCGTTHATDIAEGVRARGLNSEIIRDKESPTVRMGNMDYAACLAARAISNGAPVDAFLPDLLRQVCFAMETRPEGSYEDSGDEFSISDIRAAVDRVDSLRTVDDMRRFLADKMAEIRETDHTETKPQSVRFRRIRF